MIQIFKKKGIPRARGRGAPRCCAPACSVLFPGLGAILCITEMPYIILESIISSVPQGGHRKQKLRSWFKATRLAGWGRQDSDPGWAWQEEAGSSVTRAPGKEQVRPGEWGPGRPG